MADNPSEKKISETSGVKAVLDEAAERIVDSGEPFPQLVKTHR